MEQPSGRIVGARVVTLKVNKKFFVFSLIFVILSVSVVTLIKPAQADTTIPITLPWHITQGGHYVITASWDGSEYLDYHNNTYNEAHVGLFIDTTSNVIVDGQGYLLQASGSVDVIQTDLVQQRSLGKHQ